MTACYNPNHPQAPVDPARLQGPEEGEAYVYHSRYGRWDGEVVVVTARSYVWSPEQHNADGSHGYRHYDWKVVRFASGQTMCVDDTDLTRADLAGTTA